MIILKEVNEDEVPEKVKLFKDYYDEIHIVLSADKSKGRNEAFEKMINDHARELSAIKQQLNEKGE